MTRHHALHAMEDEQYFFGYASDAQIEASIEQLWGTRVLSVAAIGKLADAAVGLADAAGDPRGRFWARLSRALFLHPSRGVSSSLADLAVAVDLVDAMPDARSRRMLEVCDALLARAGGAPEDRARDHRRFVSMPLRGRPGVDDPDDHFVLHGRALCAMPLGHVDDMFAALYADVALTARTGHDVRRWMSSASLARQLSAIDRPAEALELLEPLLPSLAALPECEPVCIAVRSNIALAKLTCGCFEDAHRELIGQRAGAGWHDHPLLSHAIHENLANACLSLQRHEEARAHLETAYAAARAIDHDTPMGACHLQAARLARALGHDADAVSLAEQAVACFEHEPDVGISLFMVVRAGSLLAEAHAARGDFEAAFRMHRRFVDLYRQRAEHVRCGLLAARKARLNAFSGFKLSARELECLRQCAAGKTAAEIGTALGISEWTVIYHLDRVKRKFGISRRQQMVAKAASLGLIDLSPPA